MKNFRKAIRDSLHHWPAITLATLCAMGVAFLWSFNIGALLPVIQMTLEGESTQSWLQKGIEESEIKLKKDEARFAEITTLVQNSGADPLPAAQMANLLGEKKALIKSIAQDTLKVKRNRKILHIAEMWLPATPFPTICCIMGIVLLSTVIKHVLMMANDLLIASVSTRIVQSIRMRLFERALHMDRKTHQSYGTSGLLATITASADSLSLGLINLFGAAIREPLRIFSCLALACYFNWRLLAFSIVLAPMLIVVITYFSRKIRAIAASVLGKNTGFHEVILEALGNIFTVQAFTMEKLERERFQECTKGMRQVSMKMVFYTGLSRPITELIGIGMVSITVCLGSYLVVHKETQILGIKFCNEPMLVSELLIFFGLLVGASDPLRKLSGVATSIYYGMTAADSIYGVLDAPAILKEPHSPIAIEGQHQLLTVENVSFHYDPAYPILKEVQLSIPFGKTIAVLGSNGSGKSSLIQLLCRYYDPIQGAIKLDGIDYRDLTINDIRKKIAIVSQNTELFNRSVMENIRYGSPTSSREEAIEAAKLAHADNFIMESLPGGYDATVGQGGQKLSGGQRQRIALARAILRNPEILILDESTSQIDMASELLIRQTLEAMKGRFTIIIITHREALIALADETYVVQDGHVSRSHQLSDIAAA